MAEEAPPPCHDIPRTLRTIAGIAAEEQPKAAVVIVLGADDHVDVYSIGGPLCFCATCELISAGFKRVHDMAVEET